MTASSEGTPENERLPLAFRLYVALLAAGTLFLVPSAVGLLIEVPSLLPEVVLWTAFIAATNLFNVPMLPKLDVDASLGATVAVAAAVVLTPHMAVFVAALGFTNQREVRRQARPLMIVFNRAQAGLASGLAALTWGWVQSAVPASGPLGLVLGVGAAVLALNTANLLAVALGLWTSGRLRLGTATRESAVPFPRFATDFLLVALLSLLIVVAYEQVGVWAVLLLAIPLWLGYSALSSARESEDRAEELALRVRELETLNSLGTALVQARAREHVEQTTQSALQGALDTEEVAFSLAGDIQQDYDVVKVQGAEPAAVGVPRDLSERSSAVVEAVARLAGMALQRLKLERELAENEKARARLSERILEEGTQERSRIALYIHDEVLPYLAAAEIQADNVRTALHASRPAQADQLAQAVHNAVHDGEARLRQVLDELRDQILVPGGLRDGLQAALDDLDLRSGVTGSLMAPEILPPLPLAVEILVLETVRGCLANIALHARAAHAEVRVEAVDGVFRVDVSDDGDGFRPSDVGSDHHGLTLMRQRVELARGRMVVDSAPGQGTRVQLEVPV